MNGIILIDKEKNCTSFDVVYKIRKIFNIKKVGHAGTLDPLSTGVLPIFIGKATKAIPLMYDTDKSYIAGFKLGCKTDTYDRTGTILQTSDKKINREQLLLILDEFKGRIKQLPPLYSAVKYKGKPLYKYARAGQTVERKEREVTIKKLELIDFDYKNQTGILEIECSKGTYIRSICDDIGTLLNVGGIMTDLRRTRACGFSIDECLTLDELKQRINSGGTFLMGVDNLFKYLDAIYLTENEKNLFCNGAHIIFRNPPNMPGRIRVYCDRFLGLAHFEKNILKSDKILY